MYHTAIDNKVGEKLINRSKDATCKTLR